MAASENSASAAPAEGALSDLDDFAGLMDLVSAPPPQMEDKPVKAGTFVQTVEDLSAKLAGKNAHHDKLTVIFDASGSMNHVDLKRVGRLLRQTMQRAAASGIEVRLGTFGHHERSPTPYVDLEHFVQTVEHGRTDFRSSTSWTPRGPQLVEAAKAEGGVHGLIVFTDGDLDGGAKDVKQFAEDIASANTANLLVFVPSPSWGDSNTHARIQQNFREVMSRAGNGVLHGVLGWGGGSEEGADIEALDRFFTTRALKPSYCHGWVQVGPILIKTTKLSEKDNMVLAFRALLCERGEAFGNKFKDMCDAFIRTLLAVGGGAAGRDELLGKNPWMGQLNRVLLQFKYYKKAYEDADPELRERLKMEARAAAWAQKSGQAYCFDVDLPVDEATAKKLANASFAEVRPLLERLTIVKRPGVPVTAATVQASFALALRRHMVALSAAVAALMAAHVSLHHRFGEGQEGWGAAIRGCLGGLAPALEAAALDVDKLLTAPEHYSHIFQAVAAAGAPLSPACRCVVGAASRLFLARRLAGARLEYEDPRAARTLPPGPGYAYVCRLAPDPRDPLKHIQPVVWVLCGAGKDRSKKAAVYFEQADHLEGDTWLSKEMAFGKVFGRLPLPAGVQEAVNGSPTGQAVVKALLAAADPDFQAALRRFREASCAAWGAMFSTTVQAFLKNKGGEKAALAAFPRPRADGRALSDAEMQARFDAAAAALAPALSSAEEAIPPGTMIAVPPECVRYCAAERFPEVPPALLLPKSGWSSRWPARGEVQRAWVRGPAACRREYPQVWDVAAPARPTNGLARRCRALLAAEIETAHRTFFVHSAADCPVCLEPFGDDLAAVTPCSHSALHKICVRCLPLWKAEFAPDDEPECPLCRSPLL